MKREVPLVIISALYLSPCAWNVSTIPLRGEFGGQRLMTTVDAPIASYYVESYHAGARQREDRDEALDAIHRELGERLPTSTELRDRSAWLNVGGLLHGTPLADVGLSWPTCWFVYLAVLPDRSFEGIRSLSPAPSATRLTAIIFPQDTLIVNYLGIPLSGQISDQARGGYSRLKMDGPNDGLTYLAGAVAPNSVTIPELGVDHYFRRPDIDLKSLALARAVIRHIRQNDARQVAAVDAPQAARH